MSASVENDPDFNDVIPKSKSGRRSRIIEFLAGLAIIVLLIALLLPATRTARGPARRSQCVNNLKQIALALRNYAAVHDALPPAYTVDAQGRRLHSWRTLILPHLEQPALYETIDLAKPWNDPANATARLTALSVFHCPEDVGPPNTTTYLAIAAANGCLNPREPRRLEEITDAHALTLMVIEAGAENAIPWMAPVDADEVLLMSLGATTKLHHVGGMNAGFLDGSVKFLKASTSAKVRAALMTISGNDDDVGEEW
jgi:prepilin-type processing-associated H-X9-DG protein